MLPSQLALCASVAKFFGSIPNPVAINDNHTIKMALGGIYERTLFAFSLKPTFSIKQADILSLRHTDSLRFSYRLPWMSL